MILVCGGGAHRSFVSFLRLSFKVYLCCIFQDPLFFLQPLLWQSIQINQWNSGRHQVNLSMVSWFRVISFYTEDTNSIVVDHISILMRSIWTHGELFKSPWWAFLFVLCGKGLWELTLVTHGDTGSLICTLPVHWGKTFLRRNTSWEPETAFHSRTN